MIACQVLPLGANAGRLRVEIIESPALAPGLEAAVQERWTQMLTGNPRLFDGRTLSFHCFDERTAVITACVNPYRFLAVQPQVRTGVTQLGVTGLLTCGQGAERCVLLARRGRDTRLYSGRWELAPSGGVDAPPVGVCQLTLDDLREHLRREVEEELGLTIPWLDASALALCHDPAAPSVDVVFRIHISGKVNPTALNWEYDGFRWLPVRDLSHALTTIDLIEPSCALLGSLEDL
ncbi:MAG: NUDIX hydrolase [Leptolyngbya sp. PLA3]|nr:MAG: NUDIX hydrolase [Cyanobacteria bacterium CYA]MCE7967819.1 NUDIX hydrolase [Leptolyngbya sp. PL-A3]